MMLPFYLVGDNEKETLLNIIQWLTYWVCNLTLNTMEIEHTLSKNFKPHFHPSNYTEMSRRDLVNHLFEKQTLGWGLALFIKEAYEDINKQSILPRVMKEFVKVQKIAYGKSTIPCNNASKASKKTKLTERK